MIIRVGSFNNYDEVEFDERHEQLCFDELPGRPVLTIAADGTIAWRTTIGGGRLFVHPDASNAIEIGVRK